MSKKFIIKNSEGDFFQVQNYVLQLLAENKITKTAFILYSFYRSLAGFDSIECGYEFISINSGISKGSITNANKVLEKNNLIEIINKDRNKPFEIILKPGSSLPRRQLKSPIYSHQRSNSLHKKSKINNYKRSVNERRTTSRSADEHPVQQLNTDNSLRSADELINIDNINIDTKYNTTTAALAVQNKNIDLNKYNKFLKRFTDYWCYQYNTNYYPKEDFYKVLKIIDHIDEAYKLVPVLWSLNEIDQWVQKTDHSITVFVKEFINGRLQSLYPLTKHFYLDRQRAAEKEEQLAGFV